MHLNSGILFGLTQLLILSYFMENSSFVENADFFALTDIIPLNTNGSTSDTYKVRISGKWHFLKRPKQAFSTHPLYNAAFEKEFEIGYNLDHPNIVRYLSRGRDKDGFYFLTEYVDGQTLKDFNSNNPDYFKKKKHVQKFIEQLLSAISYLHQKQILHLDLKPENILITNIGYDVKIIDLGFAYTDCYQFLTTGKTNLYAAPEQISNGKIDQRTDIHGLGMVLLFIFTQTTDKKALNKISQPYKSIVSKCLNSNIEDRYFDISSLNKEFVRFFVKKVVRYLSFFIFLLGICLFLLIKPYVTKKPEISNEQITTLRDSIGLNEQKTTSTDSIEQKITSKDSVIEKNKDELPKIIKDNNTNSESITVIVKPTVKEVPMDSFCNEFREKVKNKLLKIYLFKEPAVYSFEDQRKRFEQVLEFHKQWIDSVKDNELHDELKHIFWYEHMIISFPYIREQFLAYLHQAKNQVIPDTITEVDDVYWLVDKEIAGKFISLMKEYPIITTKEEGRKFIDLFVEYYEIKDNIYEQYSHFFKSGKNYLGKYYGERNAFSIVSIDSWSTIIDNWSRTEYRTEDNPYIKIKL